MVFVGNSMTIEPHGAASMLTGWMLFLVVGLLFGAVVWLLTYGEDE